LRDRTGYIDVLVQTAQSRLVGLRLGQAPRRAAVAVAKAATAATIGSGGNCSGRRDNRSTGGRGRANVSRIVVS
jgi:hypothetical protein